MDAFHLDLDTLNQSLRWIREAPADAGTVRLIVRRPAIDEREVLDEATLDLDAGLLGDNWAVKGSSSTPDGKSDPRAQVTVVNWRGIISVARSEERCALAGDQLFVDLDLSVINLPAGSLLTIGDAVLEVSAKPHTGCHKFASRFGADALRFVNLGAGKELRLRGINTSVRWPGVVRVGDAVVVERMSEKSA